MIAAIVLHIVLTAQMTVPWIGGATTASTSPSGSQVIVLVGDPIILNDLIVLQ